MTQHANIKHVLAKSKESSCLSRNELTTRYFREWNDKEHDIVLCRIFIFQISSCFSNSD